MLIYIRGLELQLRFRQFSLKTIEVKFTKVSDLIETHGIIFIQ